MLVGYILTISKFDLYFLKLTNMIRILIFWMKGSLELGSQKHFPNCLFLEKNIMTFPPSISFHLLPWPSSGWWSGEVRIRSSSLYPYSDDAPSVDGRGMELGVWRIYLDLVLFVFVCVVTNLWLFQSTVLIIGYGCCYMLVLYKINMMTSRMSTITSSTMLSCVQP
jgi:hypothetical protein